jgi:hypothetical protein
MKAPQTTCFSIILMLLTLLYMPSPATSTVKKMITQDGTVIEYLDAVFEGEYVSIKMPNGSMRFPIHAISEKSLEQMMSGPEKPTPIPTLAKEAKPTAPPSLTPAKETIPQPLPPSPPALSQDIVTPTPTSTTIPSPTFSFPMQAQLDLKPDYPELNPKVEIKKLAFEIKSNTYDKRKVTVEVRIPYVKGKPGPNAHHLVFHAPFPTETINFEKPHHKFYYQALGFTLFSFSMDATGEELSDPKKCYWNAESGWHDVVFAAQKKIIEDHKLQPEKLFISTESAGSNMTQRMAVANPDKIRAVALYSGADYIEVKEYSPVAWLVLHGRGDSSFDSNLKLTEQLRASGSDVIYTPTAPDYEGRGSLLYYHVHSPQSRYLQASFLWAIASKPGMDQAETRRKLWPYISSSKERGLVLENTEPNRKQIASEDLVYLPGPALATHWIKTPQFLQTSSLPADNNTTSKTMLITPPGGTPVKGLVIYADTYHFTSYPKTVEDMHFLANSGYAVIASKNLKNNPNDITTFLSAVNLWQNNEKRVADLPVFLVGYGQVGVSYYKKILELFPNKLQGVTLNEIPQSPERSEILSHLKDFSVNKSLLLAGLDSPENKSNFKEIERLERKSSKAPFSRVLALPPTLRPEGRAETFIRESILLFNQTLGREK